MRGIKKRIWVSFGKTDKTDTLYPCFAFLLMASICKVLISYLMVLLSILFVGCGVFCPPTDYYQKTLDMEESAKKSHQEKPSIKSGVASSTQTVKVIRQPSDEPPIVEVIKKASQENTNKEAKTEKSTDQNVYTQNQQTIQGSENPAGTQANISSNTTNANTLIRTEPISVSPDVIKNALENAGVNVRSIEFVNGRIDGSNNSIRVNFICESTKIANDRFFTICSVTYYLNKASKSIDIVVGIAEDSQSNLLGVLQSNVEDITAWMDNKITRAEWFSRITKKML
jgi:hypothetical protein